MAAKKSNNKKSTNTATAKKPSAGKNRAKQTSRSASRESYGNVKPAETRVRRQTRSMGAKIMPYFFMIFALILCIFFVTVKLFDIEDGVGVVGYWIQYALCGLFGVGALLLPAILGYIGFKWCLYNIKWQEESMSREGEDYPDYKKARGRLITQVVMSCMVLLTVATIFGVFADFGDVDIAAMWSEAAEDGIGGGVFGSALGALMVLCFEKLVSTIILIVLLVLFCLLMFGITPDYVIGKIQERRLRYEDDEEEEDKFVTPKSSRSKKAEYEEDEAENERKRQNRMAAMAAREGTSKSEPYEEGARIGENSRRESMTVDEMIGEDESAEPVPPMDLPESEKEIYIGPSAEEQAKERKNIPEGAIDLSEDDLPSDEDIAKDYDDEGAYDAVEYTSLDSVLQDMPRKKKAVAEAPEEAEEDIDLSLIENDELLSDMAAVVPDEGEEEEPEIITPYIFPPIDFLNENKDEKEADCSEELKENARNLVDTLKSFRVGIKEITYSRGPTITRYELKPEVGIRVKAIANLVDDISLSLATSGVRIEAPIPGKPAVGIEVPNRNRATVYLRDLIENSKFTESKSRLTSCLGMDVGGNPIYFDIGKMPHLLIAGTTGSGKSICINCIIVSMLYKAKPEELKLILIDPKKVEFNMYKNIPHLYCPIVSEPKKAAGALASAVAEMERRFELIEQAGVRDIASYNAAADSDPSMEFMPHMVIIIDELADLMMTARDEVESSICRIAQKARAAGIHMILGTQRPSVDVITGLIKANVPSRIACTVMSQMDSRTIIDVGGAEKLIGRGDMLFAPVGASKPMRVQGAFVSEVEIDKIVSFVKENNGHAKYNTEFINRIEEEAAKCGMSKKSMAAAESASSESESGDSKFSDAVKLAIEEGKISTSLMQRRLGVGYGRAAKILDTMEDMGYISKPDGNKPRRVLISMDEYLRRKDEGTLEDSQE